MHVVFLYRPTQTWPAQIAQIQSIHLSPRTALEKITHKIGICSCVFFQDQSKRKQTRMTLFFVCAKCSYTFTDPAVDGQGDT